jgi:Protein of unknown function (DUF3305)
MGASITIPVGVVVAREKIDDPWQEYRWRPVSVFLNAPEVGEWRELRRGDEFVQYHAATLPLELHRKETGAYRTNLASGEPAIYVVLREDPGAASNWQVTVHVITASPFEAQAYGESGLEIIERVPMPEPLIDLLEDFIAVHHVDEPFVKRQRQKERAAEEHKFGQEPIFILRKRMHAKQGGGTDG